MSVPRIVVNETLEIKRIAVSAEGQDITVTIAEAAAGVSTVNGQSDVVVLSTDDITEGVDNLYYTQGRADARVAAGIAAIDFPVDSVNGQTGAVVLSSSNIAEGTNLYYTQARADARVAAGIAAIDYPVDSVNGKTNTVVLSTTDIGEGTNLYHTTARARSSLSGSTGISYNSTTGAIAVDSTIATKTYADSAAAAAAAAIVDSAPATLDTLNELAAALGDDANFATTVTTALGTKLNTADFNSTFDTRLATKSTTNLAEGTNLYYTTARANTDFDSRLATKSTTDLAEGTTNLYYTDARVRAVVDNNVDLDVDGSNNVYVKSIRDATYVLGELQATRNTAFINPPPNTSEVSGSNGFEAVSSGPDTAGPLGYSAGFTATYYHGETDAGSQISPTFTTRASAGTNAGGGAAVPANTVMGTFNFNGHSGTGFASYVATQNGGGGKQTLNPLQLQGYATQAFAESTISLPTTATTQSNLTIGAVASSGNGVFTNTSADVRQYDVVRVTGTLTGTMTFPGYVSGNIYYVTAGANPTTTFTLSAVHDGTPIATTAGTTTGLTFTRHRSIITFAAQTFAPFGFGSKVTVAGITPTGYNGTHRAVFGSTTTVGYGNYQTGTTQTVAGTVSIYNVTAGGTGFRVRGFPDNASYNNTNRINFINHNVAACTYRSDSFTWQGGTNSFNYMVMNAAGATFNTGNITVKDLAGTTTYMTVDANRIYNQRPHRGAVTTATVARGTTYTPAVTVNNFVELTLTAGTDPTYIDVDNLTVAGEGAHQAILIYNNSGSSIGVGDLRIRNNGVQISDSKSVVANGARAIFTVYCVGNYASCEFMDAA